MAKNDEFPRAKHLHMRMNPVLPLTFDDSLSYYEQLCKVIARVNMITDLVNSFNVNEAFIEQSKKYTDQQIANIKQQFEQNITNINLMMEQIRNDTAYDIRQLQQQIIETDNRLQADMLKLYVQMKDFNQTLDYQIEKVKRELQEFIEQQIIEIESIYVTSPVTGKRVPIQEALWDLYDLIQSFWSLTAEEYDSLELTAEEYDNLFLTAYQYDNLARWYLWDLFKSRMISPFTGKWDSYSGIINQLADLHKQALTAGQYDDIMITAGAYDALRLTSYQYDWFGKNLVHK